MNFARKLFSTSAAFLLLGAAAFAADTAPQAASTAKLQSSIVTISSRGYAQVDGTYAFHLNKGVNTLVLDQLPSQVVTSSVKTDRFTGEVTLGPISYNAANLNAAAIEAELLNKEVTLIVPGPRADQPIEVTGKLLSFDGSTAVIEDKDEYVRKVPSVQGWKCKPLPAGLNNTPSLTVTLDAAEAGDFVGIIRFRTRGVGYSTSHMWTYDEKASVIEWATDVLVKNKSGAAFANVELNVAAGDTGNDQADMVNERESAPRSLMMRAPGGGGPAPQAPARVNNVETEDLAGIQIFSVPGKANIEKGEQQLIPFYRSAGKIPVIRVNRLASSGWYVNGSRISEEKVLTILTFTNSKKDGLGLPIPRGPVSVQARNQRGTLMTVGGTNITDVALQQEVSSQIGSDWNLKATRKLVDYSVTKPVVVYPEGAATKNEDDKPIRYLETTETWNLSTVVKNGKDRDVEVVVEEYASDEYKLQPGNHGFTKATEGTYERKVIVPAGKSIELRYTVKHTSITSQIIEVKVTQPRVLNAPIQQQQP